MDNLEIILLLMALLAALYSIAEKINVPYPILLVVAGLGIGFIPGLPMIRLDPDVVFLLFLPPLLYAAAWQTSWHDLKSLRRPIARMAIGLVFFTMGAVAIVAHHFIPGFSWPLSFLLGAIVSPPDAVSAASALKGLRMPKQLTALLEGESLVNDASALIAYRYALIALVSGSFTLWHATAQFFWIAGGGIAIGAGAGFVFAMLHRYVLNNATVETSISLLAPFVSYLLAEHLGVSGVLAVVTTGIFVSWYSYELFSFQTRLKMKSFWEVLIFLLNGLVFILIGLQLPPILRDNVHYHLESLIDDGLLISAAAIVTRIVWVFPVAYLSAFISNVTGRAKKSKVKIKRNWQSLVVLSWAGMRGIVSLAAALALPLTLEGGAAFPERPVILFITFIVILVTLVLQGLSLPFLVKYLGVQEPEEKAAEEERKLRLYLTEQTLHFIEHKMSSRLEADVLSELRGKFEHRVRFLKAEDGKRPNDAGTGETYAHHLFLKHYLLAELKVLEEQRLRLIETHKEGIFTEEAIDILGRELDTWNLSLHEQLKLFA